MEKTEICEYISAEYAAKIDAPFKDDVVVFRREDNGKWFGIIMRVKNKSLGFTGEGFTSVMNVKSEPALINTLITCEKGDFLPAYHMNKTHWISIVLDGKEFDDRVKMLIDLSFTLTQNQSKYIEKNI